MGAAGSARTKRGDPRGRAGAALGSNLAEPMQSGAPHGGGRIRHADDVLKTSAVRHVPAASRCRLAWSGSGGPAPGLSAGSAASGASLPERRCLIHAGALAAAVLTMASKNPQNPTQKQKPREERERERQNEKRQPGRNPERREEEE